MRRIPLALVLVLVSIATASVFGQSLGDKKRMKEEENYLTEEYRKPLQDKCGSIEVSLDWKSYNFEWWDKLNNSIYGYCGQAVSRIRSFCDDPDAKPEIEKKIKKIVCKSCTGDTGERSIALKDGTLEWTSCPKADGPGNDDEYIKEYLLKAL